MKELSIEEKAQRYNEALKRAKKLYEQGTITESLSYVFPELRGSEDERIRKELLDYCKSRAEKYPNDPKYKNISTWIVWLERHGEQKPVPKFKIGDTMRTLQEAKDGWTDGMPFVVSIDSEYYNCNSEKIAIKDQDEYEYPPMNRKHDICDSCDEQKPAWSEEDKNMLNGIIEASTHHCYLNITDINWLKSLKDRVQSQPKQEWNEYDEYIKNGLIRGLKAKRDIHGHTTFSSDAIDITDAIEWLESLQNRCLPQPKQEWSKEDEEHIESILSALKCFEAENLDRQDIAELYRSDMDWLKSLIPQNRWKPSEEQIKVCKEVYADILSAKGFDLGTVNSELNRLEEELKKLKG